MDIVNSRYRVNQIFATDNAYYTIDTCRNDLIKHRQSMQTNISKKKANSKNLDLEKFHSRFMENLSIELSVKGTIYAS